MKRVLVYGDAISDVYSECTFRKACPDADGVFAYVRERREVRAGGAANVAANLALLSPGTQVDLIAVVDVELARALKQASQARVDVSRCVFADEALRKERVYLDGRLSVRLDTAAKIDDWHSEILLDSLDAYLHSYRPDLVLLSDYGHGSLRSGVLPRLPKERLVVDTKETNLEQFDGSLAVKLNADEWRRVAALDDIPERFFKYMIVTDGPSGSRLTYRASLPTQLYRVGMEIVPGPSRTVTHQLVAAGHRVDAVDVCGCGDTFLAGFAASMLVNEDPFTAMQFANAAAATVVTKPRTAVADLEQTLSILGREEK